MVGGLHQPRSRRTHRKSAANRRSVGETAYLPHYIQDDQGRRTVGLPVPTREFLGGGAGNRLGAVMGRRRLDPINNEDLEILAV